jgi:molecular chaperone GrpE
MPANTKKSTSSQRSSQVVHKKKTTVHATPEPDNGADIPVEQARTDDSILQDEAIDAAPETDGGMDERLQALEQEKQELSDRLLRTMAEFDNYRKRVNREKEGLLKYGTERIASELLQVVDNFERALEQSRQATEIDPVVTGLEMILKQLITTLEKFEVRPFVSVGEQFNPEIHEAMAQQEHPDYEDNTVIEQFQKGYMMGEKLLRPARVLVSRAPAPDEED